MVVWLYHTFGSWRPAFVITGLLGSAWLAVWRLVYRSPEPPAESPDDVQRDDGSYSWQFLLRQRETWGILLGKALTDPVWFFITDWFAIYLVSKGFRLESTLLGFWIPFLAADLGNFAGGGLSSYCIRRGWPVLRARRLVVLLGGIGMTLLVGGNLRFELCHPDRSLRDFDLLLRCMVHHGTDVSRGSVSQQGGRDRQRDERRRRRRRNHHYRRC